MLSDKNHGKYIVNPIMRVPITARNGLTFPYPNCSGTETSLEDVVSSALSMPLFVVSKRMPVIAAYHNIIDLYKMYMYIYIYRYTLYIYRYTLYIYKYIIIH